MPNVFNVFISVTDNYTSLTNHGKKQYIYLFPTEGATEYAKETECVCRKARIYWQKR